MTEKLLSFCGIWWRMYGLVGAHSRPRFVFINFAVYVKMGRKIIFNQLTELSQFLH